MTLLRKSMQILSLLQCFCPSKSLSCGGKTVRDNCKALCVNDIQTSCILGVFTARGRFVCKFFKHEEIGCQKIFMSIGRHIVIRNYTLVAKLLGKHHPCFPIFFIPKKGMAVGIDVTPEDMRTHVAMPFIIFSNCCTASAISLAKVSDGCKKDSRPLASRAYNSLFMPSTYELMAYSISSFCHCMVE